MAEDQALESEDQRADATGQDSAEGKVEQQEESDTGAPDADASSDEAASEHEKAKESAEQAEKAKEKIKQLEEEGPPENLEDWPSDASKYETFGGPEGEHSYDEGPEAKLGPSSLRHHEDGSVEIEGEKVDDPEKYKGDPIPGGPTDPDASLDLTTKRIREQQGRDIESSSDDSGGDDSEDEDGSSEREEEEEGAERG